MRWLKCLVIGLFIIATSPARADQYALDDATWLRKVCVDDEKGFFTCIQYLSAIADVYFLLHPTCRRPDGTFVYEALVAKVQEKTRAMTVQQQAQMTSAGVAYSSVAEVHPCQVPGKSSLNFERDCRPFWEGLSSKLLDSFQKQAILETLRNRGCLK